ncbi:MAG: EF-P beta-lysylation protein EpmB [Pseudomonadota bacterium]
MIPAQPAAEKPLRPDMPRWKRELAEAIQSPAELLEAVGLGHRDDLLQRAEAAAGLFPLRVPRAYVARMAPGDPDDPLLRQVLPLGEEHQAVDGFDADPVGDLAAQKAPGLLHKYCGRVLLVATGVCAIHCRYCFRREYPYESASASQSQWDEALSYIAGHDDIHEVILSGGDPLSLSDKRLDALITRLEAIPHLKRLRLHSRQPVVLPSRVTEFLCRRLAESRLRTVMVIHANHARELDGEVAEAVARLRGAGVHCLNQAVLLAGINDSAETLARLSDKLFEIGVLPYYLHLLDRVRGAAHFEVNEARGAELILALRQRLSGYLVPKLVREIEGEGAKTPIAGA